MVYSCKANRRGEGPGPGAHRDDSDAGAAGHLGPLAWAASSGLRDGSRAWARAAARDHTVTGNGGRTGPEPGAGATGGHSRVARAAGVSEPVAAGEAYSVRQNLSAAEVGTRHGRFSSAAGPATKEVGPSRIQKLVNKGPIKLGDAALISAQTFRHELGIDCSLFV